MADRDMIFISHANPEDNEFARWLSLRLAAEGYPVWCDVVKLLGGEDFWRDIEHAIRNRTAKFLYVLSRVSNGKDGPLEELSVARNVKRDADLPDFIVPLHIDDLPYREINVQMGRLNAVPFEQSWADGLAQLLALLERDGVPRSEKFGPAAVGSWWKNSRLDRHVVLSSREDYLSSWLEVEHLPDTIYFHETRRTSIGRVDIPPDLPFPAVQHLQYAVTFATREEIAGCLPSDLTISGSRSCGSTDFVEGTGDDLRLERATRRNLMLRLAKSAWEQYAQARGLCCYEMANGARCFYFADGFADRNAVRYVGVDGSQAYRQMVGYKTLASGAKRLWHFGVEMAPTVDSAPRFSIKTHVVFTKDGALLTTAEQHGARRSQCRDWWNADWRDRMLAAIAHLEDDSGKVRLPVGSDDYLGLRSSPIEFASPVSYVEPDEVIIPDLPDDAEEEEEE